jgi:hypothetical protein
MNFLPSEHSALVRCRSEKSVSIAMRFPSYMRAAVIPFCAMCPIKTDRE